MKQYRNNGAIGAILDEYEKAIQELQEVIHDFNSKELAQIVDTETKDPDCHSIQTILTHVINSGYYYAAEIRRFLGGSEGNRSEKPLKTSAEYHLALNEMLQYNVALFEDYPNMKIEEKDNDEKILTRWGQLYDPEQLLEHAIVHVLRHRRQVEKFIAVIRLS
jgi:uncharacterized damage-inducible protein DinB